MHEFEAYLEYLEQVRKLSRHTVRSYRNDLENWFLWLESQGESYLKPDRDSLRSYLAELTLRQMNASSVNRRLSTLRGYYQWLMDRDQVECNPFLGMRNLKDRRSLPTYLTYQEFLALLDSAGSDLLGHRNRAILESLYSTGCRVSELVALNRRDIRKEEILIRGKGGKERFVFLGTRAMMALGKYLELRDRTQKPTGRSGPEGDDDRDSLFWDHRGRRLTTRGVFHIIEQVQQRSPVGKRVTPHTLRHSFATALLDEGADIRIVQEMLGHSSLSTTQIYTHLGIEKIKQVYRQSHPHGRGRISPAQGASRSPGPHAAGDGNREREEKLCPTT